MSSKIMKQGELQERFIDTKQYNAKNEVFLKQNQWPFSDELEKKKKKKMHFSKILQAFWLLLPINN